jgi:hypothetical protein
MASTATSWPEQKADLQQRHEVISSYMQNNLPQDLQNLAQSLANYVDRGGVAQDPTQDGDYNNIQALSQRINQNKTAFLTLNKDTTSAIQTLGSTNDMNKLLLENGQLQQQLIVLEKDKDTVQQDEKAAVARDELLRGRNVNVTRHQLFLLGRPLRPASVPVLWALSVLFVGIGIIALQVLFPFRPQAFGIDASAPGGGWDVMMAPILAYLANPWVWAVLFGVAVAVIASLSMVISYMSKPSAPKKH